MKEARPANVVNGATRRMSYDFILHRIRSSSSGGRKTKTHRADRSNHTLSYLWCIVEQAALEASHVSVVTMRCRMPSPPNLDIPTSLQICSHRWRVDGVEGNLQFLCIYPTAGWPHSLESFSSLSGDKWKERPPAPSVATTPPVSRQLIREPDLFWRR